MTSKNCRDPVLTPGITRSEERSEPVGARNGQTFKWLKDVRKHGRVSFVILSTT